MDQVSTLDIILGFSTIVLTIVLTYSTRNIKKRDVVLERVSESIDKLDNTIIRLDTKMEEREKQYAKDYLTTEKRLNDHAETLKQHGEDITKLKTTVGC